jgi:hypothetical protein
VEIICRGDELVLREKKQDSRGRSRFSPVFPTTCLPRSGKTSRLNAAKGFDAAALSSRYQHLHLH